MNIYSDKKEIIDGLKNGAFSDLWHINKDKIKVCKDCEYRYMCVDNRIPIKEAEGEFFFSTECNYNPYIGKWRGEPGYKKLSNLESINISLTFPPLHSQSSS